MSLPWAQRAPSPGSHAISSSAIRGFGSSGHSHQMALRFLAFGNGRQPTFLPFDRKHSSTRLRRSPRPMPRRWAGNSQGWRAYSAAPLLQALRSLPCGWLLSLRTPQWSLLCAIGGSVSLDGDLPGLGLKPGERASPGSIEILGLKMVAPRVCRSSPRMRIFSRWATGSLIG